MQKIKIFSTKASMGMTGGNKLDYSELETKVNEFISENNFEILDLQYRIDATGAVTIATVMVVYK